MIKTVYKNSSININPNKNPNNLRKISNYCSSSCSNSNNSPKFNQVLLFNNKICLNYLILIHKYNLCYLKLIKIRCRPNNLI
jgi:hypothetical protein